MMRLEFAVKVPAEHPSLNGHFPGKPIVPGVLLLDHVLAALRQATHRRVIKVRQVKFTSALQPNEAAHALCDVEGLGASFQLSVQRGGKVVTLVIGRVTLEREEATHA